MRNKHKFKEDNVLVSFVKSLAPFVVILTTKYTKENYKVHKVAIPILFLFLGFCLRSSAQSPLPHYPDSLFSTYYHQRTTQFSLLPYSPNDIIFYWTYPGRSGSQENPLADESYEYRLPTKVYLKKGWNTILVKAPVRSFKVRGWQHPVKWMFTVIRDKR